MNYLSIDYLIVYASLVITLIIGLRAGKGIKDIREYAIANRMYGTLTLALTFLATNIGGASSFERISGVFSDGIIRASALFGVPISLLLIAAFITPNMKYFKHCITIGDVMGSLYGEKVKAITGVLGTLYSLCMVGMELLMLGGVCELLLGISPIWSIWIGGILLAAYSAHGGIKSVSMTDVFQFLVLFAVLPFLAVLTISQVGSIKEVFMQVPPEKFKIFGHEKFSYYPTLFLVWSIFPVGITSPPLFQRLLMAATPDQLRNQYFIVTAFEPLFQLTMIMIGLAGIVLYPALEAKLVLPHIIHTLLPVGIKGLAIAGMLAVVISTADSYLHAAGLLFAHDVIKPLCNRAKVNLNELRCAKFSTILIGCGAILIALQATSSLGLSFKALQFTGPLLLFPLVAGIMGLKSDQRSFYIAMVLTVSTFFFSTLFLPKEQSHLTVLASIIVNGISFFGAHLIQNKGFVILKRSQQGIMEKLWRPRSETLLVQIKRYLPTPHNIIRYSRLRVEQYGAPYILFGIFCCLNFTLPYFMWIHESSQVYELTLYIRLIGALACGLLVVREKWPSYLLPYLPTFWHLTLLYCIPFTSTVMFLLTKGSVEWLINVAIAIVFLIVLVDWMSFFILTGLGVGLGFLFYIKMVGEINFILDFSTTYLLIYTLVFASLITLLFARRKQIAFERQIFWIGTKLDNLLSAHQNDAEETLAKFLNHHIIHYTHKYTKDKGSLEPRGLFFQEQTSSTIELFHELMPAALAIAQQGGKVLKGVVDELKYMFMLDHLAPLSIKACLEEIMEDYFFSYLSLDQSRSKPRL